MATTLSTAARNASVNAVTALCNNGKIRLKSGGGTVIAEIALAASAFGAASNGSASLASTPRSGTGNASAGAGTNAATAEFTDGSNAVAFTVDVVQGTPGAGQLGLDNVSIADGQAVNVTSFTYSQPAS